MRTAFFAFVLASTSVCAQETLPLDVVAKVKQATCYIRTADEPRDDRAAVSGSGFVIKTDGTTGYIVTNDHVVAARRRGAPKVYFRSGTKAETEATAKVVASDPRRDLALLKVTNAANLPDAIELGSKTEPFETMTVYIFGFPFGAHLAMGKGNPPVNVGRGQVSSIRRDDDEHITSVLLDGALNPGNSGGPVVDARGKLVGISKATIRGANIGFAIAVPELLAMLDGDAEEPALTVASEKDGIATLTIDVPLIDPLGRVKEARLLHTRGSAKFSRSTRPEPAPAPGGPADDDGPPARDNRDDEKPFVFGPIERAESFLLKIENARATGTFTLPLTGSDPSLWGQVAFINGSGKTIHTKPGRYLFGAAKSNDPNEKGGKVTFLGEVIDPDGDCELKLQEGAVVCDVPGTLHDLNIDISVTNAPRVVRTIDGDFVATVRVAGSFKPGPVRTGPKSVPFNGGGLVVWLDQGNYIRLERGAMYRNKRVMGFTVFESREQGSRADAHNKGGLDPRQDRWLRLERRGKTISGSFSSDGKAWDELEPMELDWPSRLQAGLDAINSCGDPMSVRFYDYSLHPRSGAPQ
jgi:regulation of enolase protein 1 (concanavalin A-like superfamily)